MYRGFFYYHITSGSPSGSGFIIKYRKDEGLFKLKFNNDVSHLFFFQSYANRLSMGSVHQKITFPSSENSSKEKKVHIASRRCLKRLIAQ